MAWGALLAHAAVALGWDGAAVSDTELLGDRVDVVLRSASHRMDVLGDEGSLRVTAGVELVGILVRRDGWRSARRVAAGFTALSRVAVLLPTASAAVRADAERLGIGLVIGGDVPVVAVRPARHVERAWTAAHRDAQRELCALEARLDTAPPVRVGSPE